MFPEIALHLGARRSICLKFEKKKKFFANYRMSLITYRVLLGRKNIIYLLVYCINVIARVILTWIRGVGV